MAAGNTLASGDAAVGPASRAGADPRAVWRPSLAGVVSRSIVLTAVLGLVLAAPLLVPAPQVNIVSRAAVYAVVALSLNVLIGYTGQVSLGHSAFVGVGAFSAGFALTNLALPWAAAALVAVGIGALTSMILGGIALRIKGMYLALVTIAYGLFAERVIFNIRSVTGGGAGMPADRPSFAAGDIPYAYVCIAGLALVWAIDWRLTASKAGRAIQAIRDNERVASSWGINITGYKLLAFVISGSMAALAGALFASIEQIVSPITFSFGLSLTFVLMTVIGGVGSRPGVVIGGIIFAVLPTILTGLHDGVSWWPAFIDSQWEPLIGATLLLLTLTAFPGGLAQQLGPLIRWLSFKPLHDRHGHAHTAGGADVRP